MLSRRHILQFAPAALVGVSLARCAGNTVAQDQADITSLAQGITGVLEQLEALPQNTPGLSGAETAVQTEINAIESNAQAFANALVPSATIAEDIENAVNAIGLAAQPFFASAPSIASIIDAAVAVAQAVVTDMTGGGATASAVLNRGLPRYVPKHFYTRSEARLVLRGAHKK